MSGVSLRGVRVHHVPADAAALDEVDFTATPSEVHAVIGPNGAGKTTLLLVAAGLLRPDSGTVEVLGAPIASLSSRERARRVAVVPQGLEALPPTSVRTFVASGRYPHRQPLRPPSASCVSAVDAALERTGTTALADRRLAELSGGERQRALVARALAQDVPVLLCDEPTASLDLDQQIAVLEILAAESCRGRTVVLITHELNLASQFADRVTLLHEGRVHACGTVTDVLTLGVLTPVYGDAMHFDQLPGGKPLVVPERRAPRAPS